MLRGMTATNPDPKSRAAVELTPEGATVPAGPGTRSVGLRRLVRRGVEGLRLVASQRAKVAALEEEVARLRADWAHLNHLKAFAEQSNRDAPQFVPPGHFYSAVPPLQEIFANEQKLFTVRSRTLPGLELNESEQVTLLHAFKAFYDELDFPKERGPRRRYYFENPAYSYSDAIFLHCMLRHTKPKRIVEVGSGYSSCMTLDTNELFLDGRAECTFIEPYPELLYSLIRPEDRQHIEVIERGLQSVDLERFTRLEAGDILFIDSTHVSRAASDVNFLFFEVLPLLKKGVRIHFHDIFYPFEYPKQWLLEGRQWTEIYLLRAFLQFNTRFKVIFFNTFLQHFHYEYFQQEMPLALLNRGGSIWLEVT